MSHRVYHCEIPVTDLDRAIAFYQTLFGVELTRREADGYQMAFFPREDGAPGATGALAKGDVYVPSTSGPVLYFDVDDIAAALDRAQQLGAVVLYPKTHIGEGGFVAEIQDSEGNRIAFNQVEA